MQGRFLLCAQYFVNGEDRAGAGVHIDVRRAIERIENNDVLAGFGWPVKCDRLIVPPRRESRRCRDCREQCKSAWFA